MKPLLVGLSRSISRASDVRRAVATHGETEGCEGSLETGCFVSPVPPESHIEPLLYRDDGTGAKGEPTGIIYAMQLT
jgi:hypothetical protein